MSWARTEQEKYSIIELKMDSGTEAPSHLSDSDFWRLCHDLPTMDKSRTVDDTYPTAITIATKNADAIASMLEFSNESDEGIDPKHSEESDETAQSSSDDSLHNLYAKKNKANDLFIESHANRVNTQRIYDTIELIGDKPDQIGDGGIGHDSDAKFNSLTSNESSNGSASTTTTTNTTANTTSASNADDLLIKIAKNLKQLKENVAEIETIAKSDFDGDLIDFNDDNDHKSHGHSGEFIYGIFVAADELRRRCCLSEDFVFSHAKEWNPNSIDMQIDWSAHE